MTTKLSSNCVACSEPHTNEHMRWYLDSCERTGRDPLNTKTGGILCPTCLFRTIHEMADEIEAESP